MMMVMRDDDVVDDDDDEEEDEGEDDKLHLGLKWITNRRWGSNVNQSDRNLCVKDDVAQVPTCWVTIRNRHWSVGLRSQHLCKSHIKWVLMG